MRVALIDYGAGNVRSVCNALKELDVEGELADNPEAVEAADCLILPGVGHYDTLFRALRDRDLEPAIKQAVTSGKPLLGICLGMQALFQGSEEAPGVHGLGLLEGQVARLPESQKVPQIGWNQTARGSWFYFANSFAVPVMEDTIDSFEYGGRFSASVRNGNVWGYQFHPEKSGTAGLEVLREFLEAARACS